MQSLSGVMYLLRQAGFEISPAVQLDIAKIMTEANSMLELKLAFRMLIVNTKQEQDLFDFYWDVLARGLNMDEVIADTALSSDEESSGEPEEDSTSLPDDADDLGNYIDLPDMSDAPYCPNPEVTTAGNVGSNDPSVALIRFASDLKGTARQMIQGNERNAAAMLLRYVLTATSDISNFGMQRYLALSEVKEMLDYAVPDHSDDLLQRLSRKLDELLKERVSQDHFIGRNTMKVQQIEDLPLITLQSGAELRQALRQLGKKLASKHRRKQKQGNRKINLRQTIRANIQHGGTLLELKQQQKRLDRPRLVIMTDVSPSTIRATRMFLSILWHARQVFSDIVFYEFIASTVEVTSEWKKAESVNQAVDGALKRWDRLDFGKQNSDYHQAFAMFERLHGKHLTSKHTLVVLGDLRDWLGPWRNGSPVSATVMGRLAKQVKKMIVLNPEPVGSWNTGDSIVKYVKSKGIEVYETHTLKQLIDAILTIE